MFQARRPKRPRRWSCRYFHTPSSPLSKHHLFFQREGAGLANVNIGFIYCRKCSADGPAQAVLGTALARLVAALDDPGAPGAMWAPLLEARVIVEGDIECEPLTSASAPLGRLRAARDVLSRLAGCTRTPSARSGTRT